MKIAFSKLIKQLNLDSLKEKAFRNYYYLNVSKEYLKCFSRISNKVFFVDPMSYHNLALYDYNLLKNIDPDLEVIFFCNSKYNLDEVENMKRIYNYSNYNNNVFKTISYLISQLKLLKEIKKEKCRVIHFQWSKMPSFDCLFIKYLKWRYSVKFIYTSHDAFSHSFEENQKKSYSNLMWQADHIIVHTAKSEKVLRELGFNEITVINHGLLDIRKSYPPKEVDYIKNNKITFSLLGTMNTYKGTDLLLKAWLGSEKLSSNKKIDLLVIGNNQMNYKPIIPKEINIVYKDKIINDNEFTKWMELTDIVILPYQRISQSGLLLSALSMGKQFIVNDVGEIAKPIIKYSLGWVINEKTVLNLRKKIEEIVDEIEIHGLKHVNRETIKQIELDYSWSESGRKTSDLYRLL